MSKCTLDHIVSCLLVRQGYNAGQSVKELAEVTKKSPQTIRRWLKTTGVTFKR